MEEKNEYIVRIEKLEHNEKQVREQIDQLQKMMEHLSTINNKQEEQHPDYTQKLLRLTEVNEEMFQQLVRLRNFIEECIEQNIVPSNQTYYFALKGENGI